MYKHVLAGCVLIAAICGAALFAQGNAGAVERKRDELGDLRTTIRESEARLKRLEARSRKSAAAAAESRRQAAALDSLMRRLEEREGRIAGEMIDVRSRRDSLERLASRITDEYVRVARTLYRRRLLAPSASMLLMPEEHRRLALAERLFAGYARRQQERGRTIVALRDSLTIKDSLLSARRNQQLVLLADRRDQMRKLERLEGRYASDRRRAESEKGRLQEFIRRKNEEAKRIEGMIARLVRNDEKRKSSKPVTTSAAKSARNNEGAANTERNGSGAEAPTSRQKRAASEKPNSTQTPSAAPAPRERSSSDDAEREKPSTVFRPAWPVSGRTILHGYGDRRNAQTNTVTFNPGVNIAARSGTAVSASGAGRVSLVSWLPSYGTVVIVEHDGGWRTVYANLASAAVSEGARVAKGGRIGSVGPSVDGEYLHFEVWHEQTRLNPMTVLK